MKGNFWREIVNFSRWELYCTLRNIFRRCETLFRNCRWALWVSSVKHAKWNCKTRTEFKVRTFLHFVCCEGPMTALMLRGTIMRPLCSWYLRWGSGTEMMSVVTCHKRCKYNPGCFYNRRKMCIFIGSLISWW